MRKVICVVLSSLLILSFVFFAIGSGSSGKTKDQGGKRDRLGRFRFG